MACVQLVVGPEIIPNIFDPSIVREFNLPINLSLRNYLKILSILFCRQSFN